MHPSQTLVPRLSALISRAARRQPARLIPPAAVVAVQIPDISILVRDIVNTQHVETHAPRGFFGRLRRPRQLPAPMIAWNDHLSMV